MRTLAHIFPPEITRQIEIIKQIQLKKSTFDMVAFLMTIFYYIFQIFDVQNRWTQKQVQ